MSQAVQKLQKALNRVKAEKKGEGDQTSVSAKLTQVLLGINGCARQVDLNIDSITITAARTSSIILTGDTSSRQNTSKVMQDAMKKVGLEYGATDMRPEGVRDAFTITLESAKKGKGP